MIGIWFPIPSRRRSPLWDRPTVGIWFLNPSPHCLAIDGDLVPVNQLIPYRWENCVSIVGSKFITGNFFVETRRQTSVSVLYHAPSMLR